MALRKFRQERREAVRQYVGQHWSEQGTAERVPVNLLSLYVSVVGRNLLAKSPRVLLSTFDRGLKPTVRAMETWANKEIERQNLSSTLQRIVLDALFSIGIAKVSLADPAQSAAQGWNLKAGDPFLDRVDLDDWVFDTHAHDFREASYLGHRYRVPLDAVRDSRIYGKARKDLVASTDTLFNQEGDERIGVLGRGTYATDSLEFEEHVDLWEVYLPRHRLVLTLPDDYLAGATVGGTGGVKDALRAQRWLGPDEGPYHVLSYGTVPGNAMPKAPIQDLIDLHEAANRIFRKVIRTVDRIKEVTAIRGGAMEDGSRVMNASDGDLIRVDDPQSVAQLVLGGNAIQTELAVATSMKDLFSFMGGNLDILGGLSPQAKTAHQDAMLNENSSKLMSDMQDRTTAFVSSSLRALCWYWWNHPQKVMKSKHSLPGLPELSLTRQVTPQMRQQGRFEDLDISVDPYSMQHATPQTRMAALNQVVQQVLIPMAPMLQQRGIALDLEAYLQKLAKYMDMPDLAEITTVTEQPDPEVEPSSSSVRPPMPSQTERTYNRVSTPGRTDQATNKDAVARMLGHDMGGSPQKNGVLQ